ncbi:putative bifunctional diguanylate cyclase/phosphodiesterase [Pseudomonas putida]|uniref:EAL domain-containing protein n=1 Tax=Pseudomonas putida TaxID=303 RepID=A0AAW6PV87_PSEPU|nr:EAL domain-containing protein [Pseudomonas putida]MDF3872853.1 EAL domain-containing protein [Pseudomonas putida]MDF3878190.1 EAL domain-containing protein [Pseudomonas putida]
MQRVLRALRTLSAGNRTLLRASDESELLEAMCRVIVDEGGYRIAGVFLAIDDAPKSLLIPAYAFPANADPEAEASFRTLRFSWGETELGQNPAGAAIRSGRPCVGQNLLTDPAAAPWRGEARRFGYASASGFPLRVDGKVIGALGLCAAEADAFDTDEVVLLGELADDLAYGIGNLRARAKHREAETTIQRLAYYDPLTGLANRSLLHDRLRAALDTAHREHQPLALVLLCLDHLQEINDTLGYTSGDLMLQEVGRRLVAETGDDERVARLGEGDFAVFLPHCDADHATHKARRLIQLLQVPVEVAGVRLDVRVAIGIALYPGHGGDADLLVRRARVAMAEARRSGHGQMFYSLQLDQAYAGRLTLMADLRQAIAQDGLSLYCQPKVHIGSARLCGAEALIRWEHPNLGMVSPGEFVTLAEYSGLITPLTQWVLEAAFRHRHAWHEAGLDVPLAVNLSAHDLLDPNLLHRIEGLVATWGAGPDWIHFELTESAFMQDPPGALATLVQLKELGARLFIDDFGVGQSSLSYLQRLPVDAIKIDQSFIVPILESSAATAIVRSAVQLGHDLGLEVVAEGVESQKVLDRLTELGCDVVQGYFVSKPMPAEHFEAWLQCSSWHGRGAPIRGSCRHSARS